VLALEKEKEKLIVKSRIRPTTLFIVCARLRIYFVPFLNGADFWRIYDSPPSAFVPVNGHF